MERVTNERDLAVKQKVEVMKQLDEFIANSKLKQSQIVSNFCVLLNEKKKKIEELYQKLSSSYI